MLTPPLVMPLALLALPRTDGFADAVLPVLRAHCVECHEPVEPAGELDLTRFVDAETALAEPRTWKRVRERLLSGEMPPRYATERPSAAAVASVVAWVEAQTDVRAEEARVGRTTARRLNRFEYENAVLDLFGVEFPAEERLPVDGVGHGFDVLGDVLTLSPLLLEKAFEAAEEIAAEALPAVARQATQARGAAQLELQGGVNLWEGAGIAGMFSVASATGDFEVPRRGDYVVRLSAFAQQAGAAPARAALLLDGKELARVDVTAVDEPAVYDVATTLGPGQLRIGARFVNDYYAPDDPDPDQRDRNLYVRSIELLGPLDEPLPTAFEARFVRPGELESGAAGLEAALSRVAAVVWRDQIDEPEIARELLALSRPEAAPRERLQVALTALLASPRFLYRLEPDANAAVRPLSGAELATRLAAFLWSSVPDEDLLARAAAGELSERAGLRRSVRRMLRDARASRLAKAFAEQWLQLGRLASASPDPQRFPDWTPELAESMRRESAAFFDAILRERRPIAELLDADFTFVDERLAEHYGIPGVRGDALQRVALPLHLRGRRGGLLGQAAPLVASSMPTRTSPVLRGKWVLEALLATPPLPPPPEVDSIDARVADGQAASVREQLERHRADPACAVCHEPMDGLGFALENYGPTGAWRASEGGRAIDTRAELPGGVRFAGPAGLRAELQRDGRFVAGLAHHLVTFALGRALSPADAVRVRALVRELPPEPSLADLIEALVLDDLFRTHRRLD